MGAERSHATACLRCAALSINHFQCVLVQTAQCEAASERMCVCVYVCAAGAPVCVCVYACVNWLINWCGTDPGSSGVKGWGGEGTG